MTDHRRHSQTMRALIALMVLAWLAGAHWHGAMQIGVALGQEVCTAAGAKYVPGDTPSQPGKPGSKSCPLCAASGAPATTNAFAAANGLFPAAGAVAPTENHGAVLPASHLADLASRAPPRA